MAKTSNQKTINISEKELAALMQENTDLKLVLQSKRYRLANKLGDTFNSLFPLSTHRREVIKTLTSYAGKVNRATKMRALKPLLDEIKTLSEKYNNIMIINSIPWDVELKQRPHHLATEFSKLGYLVIFFESSNRLKRLRKISDSLITINDARLLEAFKNTNKNIYFLQLSTLLSLSVSDILYYEKTIGMKVIYDYIDELHEDISGNLFHQRLLWNSLNKINPILITVTSDVLSSQINKHYNKTKILMVKNAVNVEHFDFQKNKTTKPPKDLAPITKTKQSVVGYYGALAPWLDYDLLNSLAKKRPDLQFVYIGIDYGDALKNLALLPNVYYLGPKEYGSLSNYTAYFNCAIIPFIHGDIAKATSPVKLYEYMAAGIPTVCTRDLKECKGYQHVYISKDNTTFEKNVDLAIKAYKDKQVRLALLKEAKQNTWQQKAKIINDYLKTTHNNSYKRKN